MEFSVISLVVVAVLCVALTKISKVFKTWSQQGIQTPTKQFSTFMKILTSRKSIGESLRDYYFELKSRGLRFAGCYIPGPVFVVIEPDLIKQILVKDFNYFMNRGVYYNEKDDPLSAHLVSIEDQKWRNLRVKLTPTFTSGKMKMMFSTLVKTNEQLAHVLENVQDGEPVEIKDMLSRLNTDIIGSCAFGLDCNSLENPDTEFRQYGRLMFKSTVARNTRRLFVNTFPNLAGRLGLRIIAKPISDFFSKTIRDTVEYREQNQIYRKDFMHSMIQLKNRGEVADDEHIVDKSNPSNIELSLTMDQVAANAFVFFIAGFETSSSTMSYALYELGMNRNIQDKLREEINVVLEKHNGELTYESLMEMTYMEQVIDETLRKYPTVPALNRKCGQDYKIPGSDIVLKKDTKVVISVEGLHHDTEYYPNPSTFDPERFSEENKRTRHQYVYLPFGEGPRICIGMRFGILQTKVGLAYLLKNYEITLDPKTNVPLVRDPKFTLNAVIGGIWINVKRISRSAY